LQFAFLGRKRPKHWITTVHEDVLVFDLPGFLDGGDFIEARRLAAGQFAGLAFELRRANF